MPETQCVSDMYPLHNLVSAGQRMPDSCRTVAKYIVDNPEVASMSIGELADATGSNKTAVVRVSKLSGYGGYRALRAALLENRGLLRGVELLGFDVPSAAESDDLVHFAREVIRINVEVLQDTLTLLNEGTLRRTEDAIFSAKHVLLVGFGTSAPVAQDAYQRFLRLRVPSSTCADAHTLASIVATMGRDDLLFYVSNTGASRDVIEALETAKQRGTILSVINNCAFIEVC
jgi:RpiR family carbohydrate utilization transcriptional regulator